MTEWNSWITQVWKSWHEAVATMMNADALGKKLSRDEIFVWMEIGMRDCLRNNNYYGLSLSELKNCRSSNYA